MLGPHPNIWIVIDYFVKQEAQARHVLINSAAGLGQSGNTGRKRKLEQRHAMIRATVKRFDDLSHSYYMKSIARILLEEEED